MTATTRSCSGRLLGLLTLPWVQGPAGTVAFAGEVVEDYLVGHCCGRCRGGFGSDISLGAVDQIRL